MIANSSHAAWRSLARPLRSARWQPCKRRRGKISQADAKYQSTAKGDQRCDACLSFQPPNACKFVEGDISPSGWCELFAAKIPKDLKP
jgi:hypothetical protein